MLDNHLYKCNSFSFYPLKRGGAFASVNNIFPALSGLL